MDKLLSVEFLVKTLLLYTDKIQDFPPTKDLEINVKLGDRIKFKIRRESKEENTKEDVNVKLNSDNVTYTLFAGQSTVIPANLEEIKKMLTKEKFEINIVDLNKVRDLGKCTLAIPARVTEFVLSGQKDIGPHLDEEDAPSTIDEAVRIEDGKDKLGIIELHVRFINFGDTVTTQFQTFDNEDKKRFYFKNEMCEQGFQIQKIKKGVNVTTSKYSGASMPMATPLGHTEMEGSVFKPLFVNPFKEHASVMVSVFGPVTRDDKEDELSKVQRKKEQQLTPSKIRKMICGNRYCPVAMKFRDLGIGPFAPLVPNLGAPTGREQPNKTIGMSQMYGTDEHFGPYGLLKKKASKCLCVEEEMREYKEPCECLRNNRSEYEMKQICGYGRCPFTERIETGLHNKCCMRGSDESVFFIPGYVPQKKVHCHGSVCSTEMTPHVFTTSPNRCECTADDPTEQHVPCDASVCPRTIIKKDCDCQADLTRIRGGQDKVLTPEKLRRTCSICKCSKTTLKASSHHNFKTHIKNEKNCSSKNLHSDDSRISLRKVAPAVYPRLRAGTDKFPNIDCLCKAHHEHPCSVKWRENWTPRCFSRHNNDIDDEMECDGWDEEELFFNKKLVQSYGMPLPVLRDPTIPRCLGGAKECNCRRAPPKADCCGSTRRRSRRPSVPPGCCCEKDSYWCGPCEPKACETCFHIFQSDQECGQDSCPCYKQKIDIGALRPDCVLAKRLSRVKDDPYFIHQTVTMENCGYPRCPYYNSQAMERDFSRVTHHTACQDPDCPFRFTDCAAPNYDCGVPSKETSEMDTYGPFAITQPPKDAPTIIPLKYKTLDPVTQKIADEMLTPLCKDAISEALRKKVTRGETEEQREIYRSLYKPQVETFQSEWYDGTLSMGYGGPSSCIPRRCVPNKKVPNWCPRRQRKIQEQIQDRIMCHFLTNGQCNQHTSSRLRGGMNDLCEHLEEYLENSDFCNECVMDTGSISFSTCGKNNIRLRAGMDAKPPDISVKTAPEVEVLVDKGEEIKNLEGYEKLTEVDIETEAANIRVEVNTKRPSAEEDDTHRLLAQPTKIEEECHDAECDENKAKEWLKKATLNCGGPTCPKVLPKRGAGINPRISYNILDKNKYDFEPFYIKPVPRYNFKKCGNPIIDSRHIECTNRNSKVPYCVDPGGYKPPTPLPTTSINWDQLDSWSTSRGNDRFGPKQFHVGSNRPGDEDPCGNPMCQGLKQYPQPYSGDMGPLLRGMPQYLGPMPIDPNQYASFGQSSPTMNAPPGPCGCPEDSEQDIKDDMGYCGMPTCAFFDPADQSCGTKICPTIHADIPGMQSGDRNPYMMKRLVTLESCGSPTCPFSNPETLEHAFTELTADDHCSLDSCPYKDSSCPYFAPTTPSTDRDRDEERAMGFDTTGFSLRGSGKSTKSPTNKSPSHAMKDQSMVNYIPSNVEEDAAISEQSSGKRPPRGTCKKTTCKRMTRCPECGGISISGATCSVPFVPFDPKTINEESYEIDEEVEKRREERRAARKAKRESSLKQPPPEKPKEKERVKPKYPKNSRFAYQGGKYYPGIRCGHKTCFQTLDNVPAHMGWLWTLVKRPGWRPGVLGKTMMDRVKQRREETGIPDPPELKIISKKKTAYGMESEESEDEIEPKPTLYVKKQKGTYYITVHPLKDPSTVVEREDPYINCTPMQFVIKRNRPEKQPSISSVQCENGSEFSDDSLLDECLCDDTGPEPEVSSTSNSELSIEFTTPAGLIFPEDMKRKPNVIHTEIQYKEADLTDPNLPFIIIQKKKKKAKGVRF